MVKIFDRSSIGVVLFCSLLKYSVLSAQTVSTYAGNYNGATSSLVYNSIVGDTTIVLGWPMVMTKDSLGNAYMADIGYGAAFILYPNDSLKPITTPGNWGYMDGPLENAKFYYPYGIAVSHSGYIYMSDWYYNCIRKIDTLTQTASTYAGVVGNDSTGLVNGNANTAKFNRPTGLYIDDKDTLYVCDNSNNCIRKISPDGVVSTFAGTGEEGHADGNLTDAQFKGPNNIIRDSMGNFFVSEDGGYIRKISFQGVVTTLAGNGTTGYEDGQGENAVFNVPKQLTFDGGNNLYVTDCNNNRIRKITPDGYVTTVAGNGIQGYKDGVANEAKFYVPSGIVYMGHNTFLIADGMNSLIRKFTLADSNNTSVHNVLDDYTINIFPVPFHRDFTVNVTAPAGKGYPSLTCIVTNISGQVLFKKTFSGTQMEVDLGDVANGSYFVTLSDGTHSKVMKIIKD